MEPVTSIIVLLIGVAGLTVFFEKNDSSRVEKFYGPKKETSEEVRIQENERAIEKARHDLFVSFIEKPGTPMTEFRAQFGEPDEKRLFDGKIILLYNHPKAPWLAEFRNGKLESLYLDEKTIGSRARVTEEKQAAREAEESEQRARTSNALKAMGQSFQPKPTTTCRPGIGGSMTCIGN